MQEFGSAAGVVVGTDDVSSADNAVAVVVVGEDDVPGADDALVVVVALSFFRAASETLSLTCDFRQLCSISQTSLLCLSGYYFQLLIEHFAFSVLADVFCFSQFST